jgi:hypothetical protein
VHGSVITKLTLYLCGYADGLNKSFRRQVQVIGCCDDGTSFIFHKSGGIQYVNDNCTEQCRVQ